MDYTIFDIETDGLYDFVTKIHCLSWWRSDGTSGTITDPAQISQWESEQNILVGHNIKRYDNPVIRKLLGFDVMKRCLDTLGFSWYLFPLMKKHGLEIWGDILGVAKPHIADWQNLTIQDYSHRCQTDVIINRLLFQKCINKLLVIYDGKNIDDIMDYLTYKLECAAEQELIMLKVDIPHCHNMLNIIMPKIEEKVNILAAQMPENIKYKKVKKPAKMYNKDGKMSALGSKWMNTLFDNNLDPSTEGEIKIPKEKEPGNPNSTVQLKNWLFALGWVPTIFKYERDKKSNAMRAIPQVTSEGGEICENIQTMFEQYPYLEELESFSMLKHRKGVFQSFIDAANDQGFFRAEIEGFTNTLRFKHRKPIANLPGVEKPYGKEIRSSIIIPDNSHSFCGSDMSSLEDSTKQHYMYYYDPKYVQEMRIPGFDPHIDIGVLADIITPEEEEFFKWYNKMLKEDKDYPFTAEEKAKFKAINTKRKMGKKVNFSGIYGAGPAKISLTTGMKLELSTQLHKTYWDRNKAVKLVCKDITIKLILKSGEVRNTQGREVLSLGRDASARLMETIQEMWLYNPVSKFWYSLRYFKDIFSTLNQGTGVFCFDTWIKYVRQKSIRIGLQYHDEIGFPFLKTLTEEVRQKLTLSIQQTNDQLRLNVPLGISIDIGPNYAECH